MPSLIYQVCNHFRAENGFSDTIAGFLHNDCLSTGDTRCLQHQVGNTQAAPRPRADLQFLSHRLPSVRALWCTWAGLAASQPSLANSRASRSGASSAPWTTSCSSRGGATGGAWPRSGPCPGTASEGGTGGERRGVAFARSGRRRRQPLETACGEAPRGRSWRRPGAEPGPALGRAVTPSGGDQHDLAPAFAHPP